MASEDKKALLKNLCESKAKKYGYKVQELNVGMEFLGIDELANDSVIRNSLDAYLNDDGELFLEDFHCGRKDEHGMDGLLYDLNDLSKVIIIQTKYKQGKIDASTASQARDFFSRVDEWVNSEQNKSLNKKALDLLNASEFDPTKQEVELYFITSQSNSEIDIEEIAQISTAQYRERGMNVTCFFYSQSDFLRHIKELNTARVSSSVERVEINISEDFQFCFDIDDYSCLVSAVKGNELSNIYHAHGVGDNLFNANIRSALKKGSINPNIERTASSPDGAKKFFFFNNGVTATCTDFEYLSDTKILATNLQIVNGAQTVSSIARVLHKNPNPNLYVLLRLIATGQKYGHKSEFANTLIRYQNTQNPVKDSDFFSNDPIQTWLNKNLPNLTKKNAIKNFWYENKRGVEPGTSKGKKIGIEELGMLRYACLYEAPFTYKSAKELWSSAENAPNYWKAFGSNGQKCEEWSQEELAETGWMISCLIKVKEEHARLMKKQKMEQIQLLETSYLGVLSRYITAVTFQGLVEMRKRGVFSSFDDLIGSSDLCSKIENEILDLTRSYLKTIYPIWRNKVANPRLNLAQDTETWINVTNHIRDHVLTNY